MKGKEVAFRQSGRLLLVIKVIVSETQRQITMFATSKAITALARREAVCYGTRAMASLAAYEDFGKNVFTGKVADEYLKKHGASGDILKDPAWTANHADTVANAVFDW